LINLFLAFLELVQDSTDLVCLMTLLEECHEWEYVGLCCLFVSVYFNWCALWHSTSFMRPLPPGQHFVTTTVHSVRPTPRKHYFIHTMSVLPFLCLSSGIRVRIFALKSRSMKLKARSILVQPSLIGYHLSSVILPVQNAGDLDAIRLFQTFFDCLVWYAISIQMSPFIVSVVLRTGLCFEDIICCHHEGWSLTHFQDYINVTYGLQIKQSWNWLKNNHDLKLLHSFHVLISVQ
jgi:hypothetical protein